MFGIVETIEMLGESDPRLVRLELRPTFAEAVARANELLDAAVDEYGEDWVERASEESPLAVASNGDVTWRGYVAEAVG